MTTDTYRALRSTVTADGGVEVTLADKTMPQPAANEVVIEVQATPINPSDLGMLLAGADRATLTVAGDADGTALRGKLTPPAADMMAARIDQPMAVGNEGAGVVVTAGGADDAQALVGKTVAVVAGGMYAEYRKVTADQCLVLPAGVTAEQGASCFVNPLTALGMVETMRLEGHHALVHTAAASNLGQMLQRLCTTDDVPLVNIVRRDEQVELLRSQGANWVCNSSDDDFRDQLTDALAETGATLAFDATGGGQLADAILSSMERAASRAAGEYSRYGSETHKQVYIYGGLERSPTILHRGYGMAWGVGGWLLMPFLTRVGAEETERLRARVANEITTTFASSYTARISLAEALDPAIAARYAAQATGEKYLITPQA